MATISTHVLDTALGRPAEGMRIDLVRLDTEDGAAAMIGGGVTNADGRITELLDDQGLFEAGIWRLTFHTGDYHEAAGRSCFYPSVDVVFEVVDDSHHHVPLLVSPSGYSTYRGS